MSVALVLGVNGQDGSYLAESLLNRNIEVIGIGRQQDSRYIRDQIGFSYVSLDIAEIDLLNSLLNRYKPNYIFHVAAIHGASGFEYETVWRDMMLVNVLSLHAVLEYARLSAPNARIIYAGSAKVFPSPLEGVINADTPMSSTCLYSIGKLAARELLQQYYRVHNISTTNLVLFNHESPRRLASFILPQIAKVIRDSKLNPKSSITLRTLGFWIDWSAANELMDMVVDIALNSDEQELLMSSGTTVFARDALAKVFSEHGLDISQHIIEEHPQSEPGPKFNVDIEPLLSAAGRSPKKGLSEILSEMIESNTQEQAI